MLVKVPIYNNITFAVDRMHMHERASPISLMGATAMAAGNNSGINIKQFLAVMRLRAFFIVIIFFLVNTLNSLLPGNFGDVVYNIGRIAIILLVVK
jgi:hypothetical protein